METSDKIKQARKNAGLTQKQLAGKLGFTAQNLAQYENGIRKPKLETVIKIADALDVPTSDLINPVVLQLSEDVANLFSGNETIELLNDYTEINQLYDQLNKKGQKKAVEQVELLTKIPEYQKKDK